MLLHEGEEGEEDEGRKLPTFSALSHAAFTASASSGTQSLIHSLTASLSYSVSHSHRALFFASVFIFLSLLVGFFFRTRVNLI